MKKVFLKDDIILIEEEKKKMFSSKMVIKNNEIKVDEITMISREEYQCELNSIVIFYKDNEEEIITSKEYFDLEGFYRSLVELKKLGKKYRIEKFDIETLESTVILD